MKEIDGFLQQHSNNTFFKEFGKNKDLVMVREIKLDGTIKELNSNLIDIKNNKAGDLTAVYYPYFSQPTIIEGEVNNKSNDHFNCWI